MSSFTLTPEEVRNFRPLPGHALVKVFSPTEEDLKDSPDSLIFKPESVVQDEFERYAVRAGALITYTPTPSGRSRAQNRIHHCEREYIPFISKIFADPYPPVVYYLGRANETDNQYVVVKILQIVAVKTENGNGNGNGMRRTTVDKPTSTSMPTSIAPAV
jgi:hypothetical protein